jgi:hypothetical protein
VFDESDVVVAIRVQQNVVDLPSRILSEEEHDESVVADVEVMLCWQRVANLQNRQTYSFEEHGDVIVAVPQKRVVAVLPNRICYGEARGDVVVVNVAVVAPKTLADYWNLQIFSGKAYGDVIVVVEAVADLLNLTYSGVGKGGVGVGGCSQNVPDPQNEKTDFGKECDDVVVVAQ